MYQRYRPTCFDEVIGQESAVKVLQKLLESKRVPHAILFTGPSGCGKTTLARIMASELDCVDMDLQEINSADFRGIDSIREIRKQVGYKPLGKSRIWILDEFHQQTKASQEAMLKILEDTPKWAYFFLCTTDPGKLITTVKTRCTEVRVQSLSREYLYHLMTPICEEEGIEFTETVFDRIIEVAEGSARKALVLLESILELDTEEEQLNAILSNETKEQGIAVARALLKSKGVGSWKSVATVLANVDEEPETIRHIILGYMTTVLLSGGPQAPKAYEIIQCFRDNLFDSKKAGLVASCYEVLTR